MKKNRTQQYNSLKDLNYNYNSGLRGFIDMIFSAERIGPSGYVQVGEYLKSELIFSQNENSISEPLLGDGNINFEKIGEYERILITYLLYGQKTNNVISGAMGSGKTAIINFINEFLKNQNFKSYVIPINFNEGYNELEDVEVTIEKYQTDFYEKTIAFIKDILSQEGNFDLFLSTIKKNTKEYYTFNEFLDDLLVNQNKYTILHHKIIALFDFIKNSSTSISLRLRKLMFLLKALKEILNSKNIRLFLFVDNIDRFCAQAQVRVLEDIISLNEIPKVKSLIALRRSTYDRFVGRASFAYDFMHHHGPTPSKIIKERLSYWKKNLRKDPLTAGLNEVFLTALEKRMNFIIKDLEKQKNQSYTRKILHSLSGRSVRVALSLVPRLFINNVFPFNEDSNYKNYITKSLLIGMSKKMKFSDPLTVNIFSIPNNNRLSLLSIRILQLVMEYRRDKEARRLGNIIRLLGNLGYKDLDAIMMCLNDILDIQRPLIWMDGVNYVRDRDELYKFNDVINLTEIGYNYIKILLIDLNYAQECFNCIDWGNEISMIYESSHFYDRFYYINKCLTKIQNFDYNDINHYLSHCNDRDSKLEFQPVYISSRMVYSLSKQFISIVKSEDHYINEETRKYLLDWNDLILRSLKWDENNSKLNSIDKEYKDLIEDKFGKNKAPNTRS